MNRARRSVSAANRYAAELVSLRCGSALLPLFPNLKEVSESFAAFAAVLEHLPEFGTRDADVTVVAVGDGTTPRTGATFALRTAWNVVSIDPRLKRRRSLRGIRRLEMDARPIEATRTIAKRAIVVAVHSHADLGRAILSVQAERLAVVAMPCCVPQELSVPPDLEYEDEGCLSPARTVRVWRDVTARAA